LKNFKKLKSKQLKKDFHAVILKNSEIRLPERDRRLSFMVLQMNNKGRK